jgi:hypothetical protein
MRICVQFLHFSFCTICDDAYRLFFAGHRLPLEESPVLKKMRALHTATAAATDDDDDDDNDDVHESSHQTKWCISYSRGSSDEAHLISGLCK